MRINKSVHNKFVHNKEIPVQRRSGLTYADAGVDVKEGARAVALMKRHVRSTFNADVVGDLGGFGGLLKLSGRYEDPILVSGTDGVGTKLKLAFMMDRHTTVGQDLVAMCVNDILCQGARPLFFLDYLASGHIDAEKTADIVSGIAEGCRRASIPLLGGETAEMPDFYADGEYDMAGFAVGIVDGTRLITGADIREGDVIIGLPSSGVHSNGYSLVRRIAFDCMGLSPDSVIEGLDASIGDVLLTPTRIYVRAILALLEAVPVKGMVHITGGGFYENIPRVLPEGLRAHIRRSAWTVPPIFNVLQSGGNVSEDEMFSTFNMGMGFLIIVRPEDALAALAALTSVGEAPEQIGIIRPGVRGVTLE